MERRWEKHAASSIYRQIYNTRCGNKKLRNPPLFLCSLSLGPALSIRESARYLLYDISCVSTEKLGQRAHPLALHCIAPCMRDVFYLCVLYIYIFTHEKGQKPTKARGIVIISTFFPTYQKEVLRASIWGANTV